MSAMAADDVFAPDNLPLQYGRYTIDWRDRPLSAAASGARYITQTNSISLSHMKGSTIIFVRCA